MKDLAPIERRYLMKEIIKQISKSIIITKGYESKINDKDKVNETLSILKNEIFKDNNYLNISFSIPTIQYDIAFNSIDDLCDYIKATLPMDVNTYNVDGIFKEVELSYKRLEEWKERNSKREEALRLLEEKEKNKSNNQNYLEIKQQDQEKKKESNTFKEKETKKKNKREEEFENKLLKEEYDLDDKNFYKFYKEYSNLLEMCDKFKINTSDKSDEEYCFNKVLDLIAQSGIEKSNPKSNNQEMIESIFDGTIDKFDLDDKQKELISDLKNSLLNIINKKTETKEEVKPETVSTAEDKKVTINKEEKQNAIDVEAEEVKEEQKLNTNSTFNINLESICEGIDKINDMKKEEFERKQKLMNDELNMIDQIFNTETSINNTSTIEDMKKFLEEKAMKYRGAYEGDSYKHSNYLLQLDIISVIEGMLYAFNLNLSNSRLINNKAMFELISKTIFDAIPNANEEALNRYIECVLNFEMFIRNTIKRIFR